MHPLRSGFTLIELLVVISIIALLIAVLLPALGAARETAKTSQCVSNVKSITLAFHVYATDNEDYIPSGQWPRDVNPYMGNGSFTQEARVRPDFGVCPSKSNWRTSYEPNITYATTGAFWMSANPDSHPYNARVGTANDHRYHIKLISIKKPTQYTIVSEYWWGGNATAGWGSGSWWAFPVNDQKVMPMHAANSQTNLGFADGHAGTYPVRSQDIVFGDWAGAGASWAGDAIFDRNATRPSNRIVP